MTRNVDLVEHVIKPKDNQTSFLNKSEHIFQDFLQQLHEEKNVEITHAMKPLLNELRALTFTFAESWQNKPAIDIFRKAFGETVTKHEKFFDAQSIDAANRLYKLIFNMSREILDLVTPQLPDDRRFFTPKNPDSVVMDIDNTSLEGDKHAAAMAH
ncbi:MAG: hypothetical protein P1U36_03385 [Legionellaceae bacterium]|nr:hypothetical protein [Legionellaceae bacterium]